MASSITIETLIAHLKNLKKNDTKAYDELNERLRNVPALPSSPKEEQHVCKTCGQAMSHKDFERGKMCCDKPLFGDDEDEDEN